MSVGGILRKPVGGTIIPDGVDLYNGLASVSQLVLVLHGEDYDETEKWLGMNGLIRHAWISAAGALAAGELRREGYDLGLVVVPDPEEALRHIQAGLNTLLYTHAQYAQPRWRPDAAKGVQPWASITQQVADQARLKAEDARLRNID